MFERWRQRLNVPAFLDSDIEKIVRELGLYEKISSGELLCSQCQKPVSIDNIQCFYMHEDKLQVCCNKIPCFKAVIELKSGT